MRIKSYFARSIQEAIERARVELGPEAMLMNSRRTDAELRHLGGYEVVFGLADLPEPPKVAPPAAPVIETGSSDVLARELADLRKQIETVKRSVSRRGAPSSSSGTTYPELSEIQEQLLAADFSESTAQEIVQSLEERIATYRQDSIRNLRESLQPTNPEVLRTALAHEIDSRLAVAPGLLSPGEQRRTVVLVGPPGAGKTTCLAKLAMKFGLGARLSTQLISTDTMRVGGAEQLGAYARILGIGFEAVHSAAGLGQAIEEHRAKKVILVDTPGYGPKNMEEARELADFVSAERHIDVQLVLPAILQPSAAWRIYERYMVFKPAKLLFTHLDESVTPGGMLELAFRSALPASYIADGQDIPEDIEEASKERLTRDLFHSIRSFARAAA